MNSHPDDELPRGPALPVQDLPVILDALPIALSWASLKDGRIQFMNRAFTQLFGYVLGDFPTVSSWIDGAYPREADRQAARNLWADLWQPPGKGVVDIGPWEVQAVRADGSLITVQYRGILLHSVGVGIATFEDVSDRALAAQALRRLADEDALTGLANRRALQSRWMADIEGQREHSSAALLMADLDGFKAVNDQYGHDVGDEVLTIVGRRLSSCLREDDLICRMGGDEFVVLLPSLNDPADAALVCRRLRAAVCEPIDVEGQRLTLDVSIGVALYPQDGESLQMVLRRADQALYRVKQKGEGGWTWHHPPGVQSSD